MLSEGVMMEDSQAVAKEAVVCEPAALKKTPDITPQTLAEGGTSEINEQTFCGSSSDGIVMQQPQARNLCLVNGSQFGLY